MNIELSTTGGFAQATSTAIATAVAKVTATAIGQALAYSVEGGVVYLLADSAGSGWPEWCRILTFLCQFFTEQSSTQVDAEATVDVDSTENANVNTSVQTGGNSQANAEGDAEAVAKEFPSCFTPRSCCLGVRLSNDGNECIQSGDGKWRYYRSDVGSVQVWRAHDNDQDVCKC